MKQVVARFRYMNTLKTIKHPVMVRIRRDTHMALIHLSLEHGMKAGPFVAHVMESVALCPKEKFHAAMTAFLEESKRR